MAVSLFVIVEKEWQAWEVWTHLLKHLLRISQALNIYFVFGQKHSLVIGILDKQVGICMGIRDMSSITKEELSCIFHHLNE